MIIKNFWLLGLVIAAAIPLKSQAQNLDGFGNNVPFSMAVKQIVPSDMLVNFDPRVNSNARISWHGGSDWHAVLDNVARANGNSVEYVGQLVRIMPITGATQPAMASINVAPVTPVVPSTMLNRGGLMVLAPQAPVVVAPVVVAQPVYVTPIVPPVVVKVVVPVSVQSITPPPVKNTMPVVPLVEATDVPKETPKQTMDRLRMEREHKVVVSEKKNINEPTIRNAQPTPRQAMVAGAWRAVKGESLDQVLGDWADKAGWTLAFNSQVIYELQAGAEFNGSFDEAVASLVRSVRARPVPIATFYRGNKVLVVSNSIDGN